MSTQALGSTTVQATLSLACETVKAAWVSALKNDGQCYLGHKFQKLTKPPADGDKPTLEELTEYLKELVARSDQPDKHQLKEKVEKILQGIFKPKKAELPVAVATGSVGKQAKDKEIERLYNQNANLDKQQQLITQAELQRVPLTKVEVQAKQKQKELSVLLAIYEFVLLAQKLSEIEYQLMLKCDTIKYDMMVRSDLTGVHLNPTTTEGVAFVCKWARIFAKDPKSKSYIFSLGDLNQLTIQELDELRSFSTCDHEEIRKLATIIATFASIEKDKFTRTHLTQKYRDARLQVLCFDTMVDPECNAYFKKYAPWFSTCLEKWKKASEFVAHDSLWKANLQSRKDWALFTKEQYDQRVAYVSAYGKLHAELSAFKSNFGKMRFLFEFNKRDFQSCLGQRPPTFPTADELGKLCLDEASAPIFPARQNVEVYESKKTVPKKKQEGKVKSSPPMASAPPSSYAEDASSSHFEEAFEEVDDYKASTPVKDKIIFKKEYKNIFYDQRVKDATDPAHAFFWGVDWFLGTQYCIEGPWRNPTRNKDDRLLCLVGEIEEDGHIYEGVFTYCFDEHKICYHRCFQGQAKDKGGIIDKVVALVRWEIGNPTLQDSYTYEGSKEAPTEITLRKGQERFSYKRTPLVGIVTIKPETSKSIIRLFPIKKQGS